MSGNQNEKTIFPKGVQATANFTGKAFVNMLVPDTEGVYNCQVYGVLFEPSCRNYWHKHEGGQLLLCTGGAGYYQEKGRVVPQNRHHRSRTDDERSIETYCFSGL